MLLVPLGDTKNMRTAVLNKLAGNLAAAWPDPAQPVKLARSAFLSTEPKPIMFRTRCTIFSIKALLAGK